MLEAKNRFMLLCLVIKNQGSLKIKKGKLGITTSRKITLIGNALL